MKVVFTVLFLSLSLFSWSQQTMIIPQQYEESIQGAERLEDIIFYSFPYENASIDVRDMKSRYPELEIPDTIEIKPPQFETFSDITLLMAILRESGNQSKLLIWIAGNYERDKVTLFVDKTLDRDFTNDGRPKIIKAGKSPSGIEIYPYGKSKRSRTMNIAFPERNNPIDVAVRQLGDFSILNMTNRFSIGVHGGFGGGKLNYSLDNFDTGFPIWYNVTLSEVQLGMSLNYHIKGLRLGVKGTYHSIKQYTSYYNVRVGEPQFIVNANTGARIYRENVATDNNLDVHSSSRFQLGALAGVRISLGKNIEVQPTAMVGYLFYSSGEYVANKFSNPVSTFRHKKDPFIEGALRFEFVTGRYRSLSIAMNYSLVNWNPEGFEESFNGDNFSPKYTTIGASVGYNIGL